MDPNALPPDPYRALSVPRNASAADIKSAYRKLALKCHPDKAPDRADEFVRIQQAYEILGNDENKRAYDYQYAQEARLNTLKEELARNRGADSGRTASAEYGGRWPPPGVEIRTASFSFGVGRDGKTSTSFWSSDTPRSGVREESRRTRSPESRHSDDGFLFTAASGIAGLATDYLFNKAGKKNSETHRSSSQRKSSRPDEAEKARASRSSRDAQKEQERERERKNREKQQARERSYKYSSYRPTIVSDSDSDDNTYLEKQREQARRRSLNEEKAKYEQEKLRKRRESSARDNDPYFDDRSTREAAKNYIRQARTPTSPHPPPLSRSSTYTSGVYEDRHSSHTERPSLSRRTSTRHAETRSSPKKDERHASERRSSESVDGHSSRRTSSRANAPPLNTSYTSPPDLRSPQSASPTASRRSHTFDIHEEQRYPQPGIRRAQTMPVEPEIRRATASRHNTRDTAPERGSNLRYGETHDSGYSTSSPSEEPESDFRQKHKHKQDSRSAAAASAHMDEELRRFMESEKRPSPSRQASHSRKSPDREREKPVRPTINTRAPPVSRSASYAKQHIDEPSSPAVSSATSARRPSLSRADSVRRDTTSTRATSYSEAPRSPATPLKTSFGASYFDAGFTSSPVDYNSARDPFRGSDRESHRNTENVKRFSYAPAESPKSKFTPDDASTYDIPIRDARPSMPSRRESVRGVKSPIYDEIRNPRRGGSGERDGGSVYEERRPQIKPRRTSGLYP